MLRDIQRISQPGLIRVRVYSRFRNITKYQLWISHRPTHDHDINILPFKGGSWTSILITITIHPITITLANRVLELWHTHARTHARTQGREGPLNTAWVITYSLIHSLWEKEREMCVRKEWIDDNGEEWKISRRIVESVRVGEGRTWLTVACMVGAIIAYFLVSMTL